MAVSSCFHDDCPVRQVLDPVGNDRENVPDVSLTQYGVDSITEYTLTVNGRKIGCLIRDSERIRVMKSLTASGAATASRAAVRAAVEAVQNSHKNLFWIDCIQSSALLLHLIAGSFH
jgi:hypothetical protein